MTRLSVNLNKIALLRNQRPLEYPSVVRAAQICIDAGCHGITVHLRPDERHIRRTDVYDLAKMVSVEFNIEGNPTPEFIELVRDVKPAQCTLVPDAPEQITSDHGWDLDRDADRLRPIIRQLTGLGIRVSLFLEPVEKLVAIAKEIGADRIELYTEPYARAFNTDRGDAVLDEYVIAARRATDLGLGLNAGHDLTLDNLGPLIQAIPDIAEVSIGHALTADAVFMGLADAVRAYLRTLSG